MIAEPRKRRIEYLTGKLAAISGTAAVDRLHARLVLAGIIPRQHRDLDRLDDKQLRGLSNALEDALCQRVV